jgi:hypothetical protein
MSDHGPYSDSWLPVRTRFSVRVSRGMLVPQIAVADGRVGLPNARHLAPVRVEMSWASNKIF